MAVDMMGQWNRAVGAGLYISATRALDASGETTAIKQQNDLPSAGNRLSDFLPKFLADGAETFSSAEINAKVDGGNIGEWQV